MGPLPASVRLLGAECPTTLHKGRSIAEPIVNLGVDLPRVVVMKATEGQAVVHQQMAVRQVQHRQGRGKALTK